MPASPSSSDPPDGGGATPLPSSAERPPHRNLLFVIAYKGTAYCGWQIQPVSPTVQGVLEATLSKMTNGARCRVRAAGRTDAGVHANGQIVNLRTASEIPLRGFYRGLNSLLPEDISILSVTEVSLDFDARRHNHGKRYCYSIVNRRPPAPDLAATTYHVHRKLDLGAMAAAARLLVGTHDFNAFRSADCERETSVRTLYRCSVSQGDRSLVQIHVEGTAFLRNMVRIIAGTLVEIGKGRWPPDKMVELLHGKNRTEAGFTMSPQGLCLEQVFYYFPDPLTASQPPPPLPLWPLPPLPSESS
jgi:tRNA pseudouridine38-40 synthase